MIKSLFYGEEKLSISKAYFQFRGFVIEKHKMFKRVYGV
jgi:hypothetical protein